MMKRLAAVGFTSAALGGALLTAPPAMAATTATPQVTSGPHHGHHSGKCAKSDWFDAHTCAVGFLFDDIYKKINKKLDKALKHGDVHYYKVWYDDKGHYKYSYHSGHKDHGHHDGYKDHGHKPEGYTKSYYDGYKTGYDDGRKDGYHDKYEGGHDDHHRHAFDDGYRDGYKHGYSDSQKDDGHHDGYKDNGHHDGHKDNGHKDDGHHDGHKDNGHEHDDHGHH